jgi:hypothetical protein
MTEPKFVIRPEIGMSGYCYYKVYHTKKNWLGKFVIDESRTIGLIFDSVEQAEKALKKMANETNLCYDEKGNRIE